MSMAQDWFVVLIIDCVLTRSGSIHALAGLGVGAFSFVHFLVFQPLSHCYYWAILPELVTITITLC